ncbi:rod shape-determining protein RodA [Sandaracinobacter sp. RS1-74]|uniref:rod shape-determining protein RodA n=1 Tax=Sandaracinobacteroides sayramensis TaxID=2913411 RepID=UPI001EDA60D9|nr:rod shape-determining protein RodA [Sandaracinobacteroides sayramensis]MCG2841825.1 rod shape-determining protein RodA [Sandaracinobacteroides sayramensis]
MIGGLLNSRWPQQILALPWRVILLVAAIGGFAVVVLYSAAGGSMTPWALNHAVRFSLFLGMALVLSQIPLKVWIGIAYPAYGAILVALVGVEVLGAVSGGSQRWLELGFIRLQPSEFMKLAIVLALARFYHYLPRGYSGKLAGIWPPLALIGTPAALVMLQPDLGTALMIVAGGLTMMFLGGLPLRWLLIPGTLGLASLPLLYNMLHDYQKRRVLIFLNPETDPLGAGYHITQSKIAIGSGGLFGKGFLKGSQSHLQYLPEQQTDFVFATMAEEWGLAGGVLLLLTYGLVLNWGIRVGLQSQTLFARLLAVGLSMTIFFYVLINTMMVMGLAPVVGIPFPLLSYGGSAMLTVMIAFGILMSVHRQRALDNL